MAITMSLDRALSCAAFIALASCGGGPPAATAPASPTASAAPAPPTAPAPAASASARHSPPSPRASGETGARAAQPDACAGEGASSPQCACRRGDARACLKHSDESFARGEHDAAIIAVYALCYEQVAEACLRTAHYFDKLNIPRRLGTTASELRERGLGLLERGCAAGQAGDCFGLGRRLFYGRLVARDLERGARLAAQACDSGHAAACGFLANVHDAGLGVARDRPRALTLWDRACRAGDAPSCTVLADRIGSADVGRARELYDRACAGDDGFGCAHSGRLHAAGGGFAPAARAFLKACELEHWASCADASALVAAGKGVAGDPARARDLYQTACDQGVGRGCVGLASLVARGVGGERNWGDAVELYQRACALEVAGGCSAGARLKRRPPDWRCKTIARCETLCAERLGKACRRLGDLRAAEETAALVKQQRSEPDALEGRDEPDCPASAEAYERACELGDGASCLHVGKYDEACRAGDARGCLARDYQRHEKASPREQAAIVRSFESSCRKRRGSMACVRLARLTATRAEARRILRDACDRKNARACFVLAVEYPIVLVSSGGTSSDVFHDTPAERRQEAKSIAETESLLRRACELGHLAACRRATGTPEQQAGIEARTRELLRSVTCDREGFEDREW